MDDAISLAKVGLDFALIAPHFALQSAPSIGELTKPKHAF